VERSPNLISVGASLGIEQPTASEIPSRGQGGRSEGGMIVRSGSAGAGPVGLDRRQLIIRSYL